MTTENNGRRTLTLNDQNDRGGTVEVTIDANERGVTISLPYPDDAGAAKAMVLVELLDGKLQLAAWDEATMAGDDPTVAHILCEENKT